VRASITDVGGGWRRCEVTGYATATVSNSNTYVHILLDTSLSASYEGTTDSGLYIWGVQCEKNSGASQYIKTSGTTASPLYSTGSVGTVTVGIGANVAVTGVNATVSVGTVTVSLVDVINVDVTGVYCTGGVGTITLNYDYAHTVTGVSVNGAVGSVTIGGTGVQIWTNVVQATSTWDDVTQVNSTWTEV
jgi:hypothetical protein